MKRVAITGSTGYLGRALSRALLQRGHEVRALARPGAKARTEPGTVARELDVFDEAGLAAALAGCETLVHLIGTPHPNPSKATEFRDIDLRSAKIAALCATRAGISHFVYVSVAQPAPVMQAYVQARAQAEEAIRATGLAATIIRPWYVLGPGHRWPYLLLPLYAVAKVLPGTAATARRLDLVTLHQMTRALAQAVENPPVTGMRVIDVPEIRALSKMAS